MTKGGTHLKINIPQELKLQAARELPLDCKGQRKCSKQPPFQMHCECECYKINLSRLIAEYRNKMVDTHNENKI